MLQQIYIQKHKIHFFMLLSVLKLNQTEIQKGFTKKQTPFLEPAD